mmetsp:Transcript_15421/g.30715  ORF Transcript_15421/g.30715 Transcript_15421/m.30715 type:complete len:257 (+) Transcript_15421:343-1113(+)
MSAMVVTTFPPVALASLLRSSLPHRRAATHPASTKYLRQRSSIPLVVSITLAPAPMIFIIRSLVISISRCRMLSISARSVTVTSTPMAMRCRWKFISSMAILAPETQVGMPWEARETFSAKPSTMCDSVEDFPCAFRTWMADRGYRNRPSAAWSTILTDFTASTAMREKNSDSGPIILLDIDVLAEFIRFSSPNRSTFTSRSFLMCATAAFSARRYPVMILVGWIPRFMSSLPRFSSSDATITTLVVPSPTSWSCK